MIPSAKKLLLAAGDPQPFALSGGWETGNEGWTYGNGMGRRENALQARTGSFWIGNSAAANGYASRIFKRRDVRRLKLNVSVWVNSLATGNAQRIAVICNGTRTVLAQSASLTMDWIQLSGTFQVPFAVQTSVDVRLEVDNSGKFDDWSISGVEA